MAERQNGQKLFFEKVGHFENETAALAQPSPAILPTFNIGSQFNFPREMSHCLFLNRYHVGRNHSTIIAPSQTHVILL